jgi:glycosyltransferase involved in cell wall biosynthesis
MFGGQLRSLHSARALNALGRVDVLVVGSEAGSTEARSATAREFTVLDPVIPVASPRRSLRDKLRWLFDSTYLDVHGYVATPADQIRLDKLLPRYDLIWVLNARTPNLLNRWSWSGAHLDLDDIPSTYFRSLAEAERRAVPSRVARIRQLLARRRELHFHSRFTTLSVCSEPDRTYLGGDHVHVIPNGFARPQNPPRRAPVTPPRIGFIGLYSYSPNMDGVRWFLQEIWPRILHHLPNARFRVVGRDSDGPAKPVGPNVDVLGWLDDPAAEISSWSATVVPIRFGGGTRVKLADAFSRKCPVVSTSLGAFGYAVRDRRELRLADQPESFAQACIDLVSQPADAANLADQAWDAFLRQWTWEAIQPRIVSAARDCLSRDPRKR